MFSKGARDSSRAAEFDSRRSTTTYPLHVIVLGSSPPVAALPTAFKDGMERLVGLQGSSDTRAQSVSKRGRALERLLFLVGCVAWGQILLA